MNKEHGMNWNESIVESIKENEITLHMLLNKVNKFDVLLTLLSILDAQENELNLIMQELEFSEGKSEETILLAYSNSYEHFYIILYAINYILENSKNSKYTFTQIPKFDCVCMTSSEEDFHDAEQKLHKKYNQNNVKFYRQTLTMQDASIYIRRNYVLRNFKDFDNPN